MKYLVTSLLLLIIVFIPDFVQATTSAASSTSPGGLVPCQGADCTACDLLTLGNNLLNWLIGFLMVVFAIIMVIGGFQLVTSGGNTAAMASAKGKVTNALIGLIIVLAAWLLVDTLMRMLLPGDTGEIQINGYGPWSEVECKPQSTAKVASTKCEVVAPGYTWKGDEAKWCRLVNNDGTTEKCCYTPADPTSATFQAIDDLKARACVANSKVGSRTGWLCPDDNCLYRPTSHDPAKYESVICI